MDGDLRPPVHTPTSESPSKVGRQKVFDVSKVTKRGKGTRTLRLRFPCIQIRLRFLFLVSFGWLSGALTKGKGGGTPGTSRREGGFVTSPFGGSRWWVLLRRTP